VWRSLVGYDVEEVKAITDGPSRQFMSETKDIHTISRKDFEDYEFILAELEKMVKMNFSQIREHQKTRPEDILHTLRHPKDGNLMLFTREGAKRFRQIGRRGIKLLGPEGRRYDFKNVVTGIQKLFLERYFEDPSLINDENAHDIFSRVVEWMSQNFTPATHYFPCSIVAHRIPVQFRIGPVQFQLSNTFWETNGDALLEGLNKVRHDSIKQFFTQQMWIASVQVDACDPNIATSRATESIQSALDLFKLFAGTGRGAKIGHAYAAGPLSYSSRVYSDANGFHLTQTWASRDAVVRDNWLDEMVSFPPWQFGEDIILKSLRSWDRLPDAEQRFLDGLAWHGDGVSEPIAAARIIKFWTAIERILTSRIRDKITPRVALLSSGSRGFPQQFRKCQRLYSLRSEIIHGTYNDGNEKLESGASEIENISQAVVTWYGFVAAQLKSTNSLTRDHIKLEFAHLDQIAKRSVAVGHMSQKNHSRAQNGRNDMPS
jgi:Apea-like HEPN